MHAHYLIHNSPYPVTLIRLQSSPSLSLTTTYTIYVVAYLKSLQAALRSLYDVYCRVVTWDRIFDLRLGIYLEEMSRIRKSSARKVYDSNFEADTYLTQTRKETAWVSLLGQTHFNNVLLCQLIPPSGVSFQMLLLDFEPHSHIPILDFSPS